MERECIQYFKANRGFKRLFEGLREKYRSLGSLGGIVNIANLTAEEKDLFSGFFRKDYYSKKSASIKVDHIILALEKTKFQGVDLEEVLKGYFGGELLTKKEEKNQFESQREKFFEEILLDFKDMKAYEWLSFVLENKINAYRLLCQKYDRDQDELKEILTWVMKGLNLLPFHSASPLRMALFSSMISKNPHTFDQDTEGGNLLLYGILYFLGLNFPQNAEDKAEALYRAGLIKDEISNYTTFSGLLGYKDGKIHRGWQGFCENKEPLNITLWNLSEIDFIECKYNKAFVFENPTVFSEVLQSLQDKSPPLICTYGQVKLASLVLMDKLVDTVEHIYYSGDFDPEGLQIADKLKIRYGEKLVIWRYGIEEYESIRSIRKIEPHRTKKLDGIKSMELKAIVEHIKREGYAAYQELLIEKYIEDIKSLL